MNVKIWKEKRSGKEWDTVEWRVEVEKDGMGWTGIEGKGFEGRNGATHARVTINYA